MRRHLMGWAALLGLVASASGRHDAYGTVVLDGARTRVHWTDGDSFKVLDGPFRDQGTRLIGYNTLEAYGPVHQWGEWKPAELFELARDSARVAASSEWDCTTDGHLDGYHRLLVDCPALTVEMARLGYGHAYAVDGRPAAPEVLAAQREAQAAGRGMWRKGVPKGIVTSVHAWGEPGSKPDEDAYNRVVDTRTGASERRPHRRTYRTCEVVCEETEGDRSCLVYVPFERRYRGRPACLR